MKIPLLVSVGLLGLGVLVLLAQALPHVGPMLTVPLEHYGDDVGGSPVPIEAIAEARIGWSAISLVVVSVFAVLWGWLWLPLHRRVVDWAANEPAIKEVFRYQGVRFVSTAPTRSLTAIAVTALFPLWVLLPSIHHAIGSVLLPVPSHLVHGSFGGLLMCLPLAVGYGLYWRARPPRAPEPAAP